MAKRRVKKRTHIGARGSAPGNAPSKPGERTPKSMVIRIGASEVGPSVSQLVHDVRTVMEPHTATRLKERRSNKLRDYTTMAGPLGVTHLMLFSRSENGNTNMRLAVTPRGPTFHFRVEKYSLAKDVHRSMKRPKTSGQEHLTPPLLVMNNFSTKADEDGQNKAPRVPKHLESLTTTVFQSLFPPINPTKTPLHSIKRVLLLDRAPTDHNADHASYVVNLRHYSIETRTAKSVPKALRRLDAATKLTHNTSKSRRGGLPNLGKLGDVADYLLDPHAADGFTSGSDSEPETDAEVEVLAPRTQKFAKRSTSTTTETKREKPLTDAGRRNVERKGIKLHELGPRLRLRLTKVEEGMCTGKIMWHEYIHKSKEELKEMERVHAVRRQEKERRKAEQKANVERKKAEKAERRAQGLEGGEEDGEEDEDEEEDHDFDDDEWADGDDDEMEEGDDDANGDDEEMEE